MNTSQTPSTMNEALRRAAMDFSDRGIAVFDGRGRNVERRTYRQLFDDASAMANRLAAVGINEREPVLVALPTSWDWLECWFGLLLRGAWPVAASGAGAMAAAAAQLEKIDVVRRRLGARYIIAGASFRRQAEAVGFDWATSAVLDPSELRSHGACQGFKAPSPAASDVAFLQLTSGSTGVPRAVMIPHQGAIHNPVASSEAIGAPHGAPVHEWADAMVSWLPLYHDMGLIGCLMLPVLCGLDSFLLRPQTFLARPRIWLDQLARHGKTFVPAPNFGYQLCVERIKDADIEGLDLSSWKAALTGAEMIRTETTDAFTARFEPAGFDPRAFRACYGLAEATLSVTFDGRGEGIRSRPMPTAGDSGFGLKQVVSTGAPIRDTEVQIVAPDGAVLGEERIGEIRFRGPGTFLGYFNDPEGTAECLRDGWFHSGDLGFFSDGELYITGRSKDLLILRGHNLMPDELERIADGITGSGGLLRSAAFSVVHGPEGEEPVLVVETEAADPDRIATLDRDIRVAVGRALGLPLADVVFVRRGRIPRTSSGKMRRAQLRSMYLDGSLRE